MSRNNEFLEETISAFDELEDTKVIIHSLLKDLKEDTLKDFFAEIQTLISGLNVYTRDSLDPWTENKFATDYYAVHFEAIEFNYAQSKNIIYIGFGIDCNMQKNILGFWLKHDSESYYHFWLKVFQQLKQSGMQTIELNCTENSYLLNEARKRIFN